MKKTFKTVLCDTNYLLSKTNMLYEITMDVTK